MDVNITKQELKDLLRYLEYTDELQIAINKLYLAEVVKIAIDGLGETE